jgi:regulator of RNase E activity RraA
VPCFFEQIEDAMNLPPEISTSLIGDVLDRLVGMSGLTRYDSGGLMVGRARTVRTRPGDNLAVLAAIPAAQPGDILVVEGSGDTNVALAGEILMAFALSKGIRGIVIDGAVRDTCAFRAQAEFACFARGAALRGPSKTGPGAVNVTISVAGQVVQPGDFIVGDGDGVIAIPSKDYEEVIAAATRRHATERRLIKAITAGDSDALPIARMLAEAPGKIVLHE